jgi:hypothetical protein
MPEYLPELVDVIRSKKEALSKKLDIELEASIMDLLGNSASSHWHELLIDEQEPPSDVIGTDGSQSARVLWNGSTWWVVRAIALTGSKRVRLLDTGFTEPGVSEQDFRWYLGTKMDDLENKAAFEGIKELNGKWLLLDGSLFGRLQMLPVESPVIGDRSIHLDYYDTILNLLEYCRVNKIGVISISKDSRIRHFVRFLILERVGKLMKSAKYRPSLEKRQLIRSEILSPSIILEDDSLVEEIRSFDGGEWNTIAELLKIAAQPISDHVLMQHMLKGKGYTSPIILNMSSVARSSLESAFQNPDHYLKTRFKKALQESDDKQSFRRKISKMLSQLREIPSVVSFHIRLHPQDTPLRIDIPGWMVNVDQRIWEPQQPKKVTCDLTDIFQILTGGYGGLENYNIWQKRADELARLSRDTVDNLYRQAIEKELGTRIEFERGYRRVYYP